MNTTLAIQITQEDIDVGGHLRLNAGKSTRCPGALALKRAMQNRGYASHDICCYGRASHGQCGSLSHINEELRMWQLRYDGGHPVEPTEFLLFFE